MQPNDNGPLIDVRFAFINIVNIDNDHDNCLIRNFRVARGSLNIVDKLTL
jgi:hypothetical protein